MAQTMARLEGNVVVGLEWWNDYVKETDNLKYTNNIPVAIDDTYSEGKYYRNGKVVLTYEEEMSKAVSMYASGMNNIAETLSMKLTSQEPEKRVDEIVNNTVDVKNALTILGLTGEEEKV